MTARSEPDTPSTAQPDAPLRIADVDPEEFPQVLPVLRELRPHVDLDDLREIAAEGAPQGLVFTAAWEGGACVGVAGWRILALTHTRRKLYVDDLVVTATRRSSGVGSALLGHLQDRARTAGCRVIDLDSGVQRHGAHRFYLREGFDITSHHFSRDVPGGRGGA